MRDLMTKAAMCKPEHGLEGIVTMGHIVLPAKKGGDRKKPGVSCDDVVETLQAIYRRRGAVRQPEVA